ncbi:MAG TPA: DUF2334 domain-containing protein [Candidatus Andersenbacteria bacterium]|nr:DUF2334 domain-containing protein [Candidatus Andersenbacteria bacterium]
MNTSSYLLRIDDACPTMRRSSFERIRAVCDSLNIKPIIGIIPDNQDPKLIVDQEWPDFWPTMRMLADHGWIVAQHGYQHLYNEYKTEFAGLPYDHQLRKITEGKKIIAEKIGHIPTWFMAPAHSYDKTTCAVLKKLHFTHITDGIAPYPFIKNELIHVPQQLWRPRSMPFGLWTICLHPNTMSIKEIHNLIAFMESHKEQFLDISLEPQSSPVTIPMQIAWKSALMLKRIWRI